MTVRVLHVFSTFAPGGPQVRTARLLPELERSWRHAILALDGCTDARALLAPELEVEILAAPRKRGSLATTRALVGILKSQAPDLLLTYNWGALDALLASRIVRPRAVVHHEDGFRPDEVAGFKARRVWVRRWILPGTSAVIVPSRRLEEIARELWKLDGARLARIANGLDVAGFPRADGNASRRRELGIPNDALVIGAVGHLRAEKNPVRLIQACARMTSQPHLLVLGDGPERPAVERAVRELGLESRVHLVGHRPAPQADYRAMDVFALSSDTEQMPVALLEAMACSLPVVSTDVGDVKDMLPAEQASFVVPLAADALAQAAERLLADAELRRALGAQNRARVEREYSFAGMVRAYREVYERALGLEPAANA